MAKRPLTPSPGPTILLGVTGASGAVYTEAFARTFPATIHVIPTRWGKTVFENEMGKPLTSLVPPVAQILDEDDLRVPFASGSAAFEALVILPCSVSTLAKIAHGISDNLLTRVAQVALKERRRLIICLREAPLSTIALRNATLLSEAGAIIFPLCPGFYFHPRQISDLVETTVERIGGLLGVPPRRQYLVEDPE